MELKDAVKVVDLTQERYGEVGVVHEIQLGHNVCLVKFDGTSQPIPYGFEQLRVVTMPREDRPEMLRREEFDPQIEAMSLVRELYYDGREALRIGVDVYVVWYCYILGNWKVLVSTNVKDNRYYEVTYDMVKKKIYLDNYVKTYNIVVDKSSGDYQIVENNKI